MVNGYNLSVHSNYIQQGNATPLAVPFVNAAQSIAPAQNLNTMPQNFAQSTNMTVRQTLQRGQYNSGQSQTLPQHLIQNQKIEHKEEKENLLWRAIKSDKTAIAVGTVVSAGAILAMILSPKSVKSIQKNSKKCFIRRFVDGIKTKWQNYRADYKARMAAKAPERNNLTPNLIT